MYIRPALYARLIERETNGALLSLYSKLQLDTVSQPDFKFFIFPVFMQAVKSSFISFD